MYDNSALRLPQHHLKTGQTRVRGHVAYGRIVAWLGKCGASGYNERTLGKRRRQHSRKYRTEEGRAALNGMHATHEVQALAAIAKESMFSEGWAACGSSVSGPADCPSETEVPSDVLLRLIGIPAELARDGRLDSVLCDACCE